LVKLVNTVKNLKAEFLDHRQTKPPFFIGWEAVLDKYFQDVPPGYTGNFYFEFSNGKMVARHLCSTPDEDAWGFEMCKNPDLVKKAICQELFGVDSIDLAEFEKIRLPRHPGNALDKKNFAL